MRKYLYLGGVALFALAGVELVAPGTIGLPIGEGAATFIALLSLLYAMTLFQSRRSDQATHASTPDVELPKPTTVPGGQIDEALERFPDVHLYEAVPSEVKAGLEEVAIETLVRNKGHSRERASELVQSGEWTDDPVAADFLSDRSDETQSLRDRVGALLSGGRSKLFSAGENADSVTRTIDGLLDIADERSETALDREMVGTSAEGIDGTTVDPSPYGKDSGTIHGINRQTNHWHGVGLVALVCLGVGVLSESPAVLLGAVVGIVFAAYARSFPLQTVDISIERTLSEQSVAPGETVSVTVRVTNEMNRLLTDLRLVDGVPAALEVTDGSPRLGTALRPGETSSFEYTVECQRGTHAFEPALALVRNPAGAVEREYYIEAETETVVECRPSPRSLATSVPLHGGFTGLPGRVETDDGGSGVAFQTIREYKRGDPLGRVDWKYHARTGDLATVDFQKERAATVVLLVDTRQSAYVGPDPTTTHAVDRSVIGASRLFERLLDDGNQVGVGALTDRECWLAPGAGSAHRHRGRDLFATAPAFSPTPSSTRRHHNLWLTPLRRRLPEGGQLIVFTPLLDHTTVRQLQRLAAYGHPVTVISPDPTARSTAAEKLVGLQRSMFLTELRESGISVADWDSGDQLAAAVQSAVIRQ